MREECNVCGVQRAAPPRFSAVDDAIKAKGSVMDFVRMSGVNQQTYHARQAARSTPTLGLICKVLRYTGLSFDEAFGDGRA